MVLIMASNVFYMKLALFTFTFFIFMFGTFVFAFGVSSYASLTFLSDQMFATEYHPASLLVMAISFAVLSISLFGCFGAFLENLTMLRSFSVILSVVIITQSMAAGFLYAHRNKLVANLTDSIHHGIIHYNGRSTEDTFNSLIDMMQSDWKCCGVVNSTDWKRNKDFARSPLLPASCCSPITVNCNAKSHGLYTQNCGGLIAVSIHEAVDSLVAVAIALAGIQVVAIVLSCSIVRKKEVYQNVPQIKNVRAPVPAVSLRFRNQTGRI